MEPNEILAFMLWLCIIIITKVGFIGMSILIQHAMPEFIARAQVHHTKKNRKLMILLGFINAVGIPFLAILLISSGVLAKPGLVLFLLYLWLALLSFTVIYRTIGSNVIEENNSNQEIKITLFGGLIAEAAFFTPVLGQFYSLSLFFRSLGAVLLVFMKRTPNSEDEHQLESTP